MLFCIIVHTSSFSDFVYSVLVKVQLFLDFYFFPLLLACCSELKEKFFRFPPKSFPLAQCRQLYCGMDVELRNDLQKMLEEKADKYGLEHLFFMTFSATQGFRSKMCAADYVYGTAALLEHPEVEDSPAARFFSASDALDL